MSDLVRRAGSGLVGVVAALVAGGGVAAGSPPPPEGSGAPARTVVVAVPDHDRDAEILHLFVAAAAGALLAGLLRRRPPRASGPGVIIDLDPGRRLAGGVGQP
ncbi:hypothetical protein [Dactylosporangium sp. NPDC049140]|uniref:hypothetical protein n=1 Tax=Dactylosporangium sp. NPDC049140 TaxID=3155647 RepID=UPI0033F1C7C3